MISEIAVSYLSVVSFGEPLFLSCTTSTHIGTPNCVYYSLRCSSPYSCFLFPVLLSYAFWLQIQALRKELSTLLYKQRRSPLDEVIYNTLQQQQQQQQQQGLLK